MRPDPAVKTMQDRKYRKSPAGKGQAGTEPLKVTRQKTRQGRTHMNGTMLADMVNSSPVFIEFCRANLSKCWRNVDGTLPVKNFMIP